MTSKRWADLEVGLIVEKDKMMNNEELRLLRENNAMLRQMLIILQNSQNNYGKDFIVNVLANLTADGLQSGR